MQDKHTPIHSQQPDNNYIGRFAPTPSGPLHFGSLVTALGSYLDAKAHHGKWLLRIEDVDTQRSQANAIDTIYRQLDAFGLHWDGEIRLESAYLADYESALNSLTSHTYPCTCSRKHWQAQAKNGALGAIYPRFCAHQRLSASAKPHAIRLSLPDTVLCFHDRLLGKQCYHAQQTIGDPILKRRDGDIAYALAVVIDDAAQGVTDVVRGQDLLATTIIQQHLQTLLQLPTLRYLHLPLALNAQGKKLSKQNHAPAVEASNAQQLLQQALLFLGQTFNPEMLTLPPNELLKIASKNWQTQRIPTIAHSDNRQI